MKKAWFITMVCLAIAAWAGAGMAAPPETPKPGLKVVDPPGQWAEFLYGGGEGAAGNVIAAWAEIDGSTAYEFTAVLQDVVPAEDPNWQWKTTYVSGTLTLYNLPGTPWYNKKAGVGPYVYGNITVENFTWKDDTQIEFALVGWYQGQAIIMGGATSPLQIGDFAGVPGIYGDLGYAKVNAYPQQRKKK